MQRNWRNLIRPRPLEVDELTETYGKFVVEPLERGYGQTMGNSLRRVLLSSIRGAAITGIRMAALGRVVREDEVRGKVQRRMVEQMQSALHEFQALPDIVEDVAEVVLNLKEVHVHLEEVQTEYLTLVAEAPGRRSAASGQGWRSPVPGDGHDPQPRAAPADDSAGRSG